MISLVDPYAASTSGFVHRCCTQFSIKRCLQPAHACRPPLRTCVVAHHAPRMAPCPRRVPLAMRTPASRRPHGDRPVALRSPLKDRKATARHGNALHPREGVQACAHRPRVPLEPCRRERPQTGGEEWRRRRDLPARSSSVGKPGNPSTVISDFMRGMNGINQLIYVVIPLNSEAPYVRY